MLAKDVMTTKVVKVSAESTVPEIAQLLMKNHISGVPVVGPGDKIVGIVSEGDLLRRSEIGTERHRPWWLTILAGNRDLAREYVKAHGLRARDVMTRDVLTVAEDAPLTKIASILEERGIKRVPVVRAGKLVGIIARADVVRVLASAKADRPSKSLDDDRAIREGILKTLRGADWSVSPYVNVIVTKGMVHVWGLVDSEEEKEALRVACENVAGVKSVEIHARHLPSFVGSE